MDKKIAVILIVISLLAGFGIGKIYEAVTWQAKLVQIQQEIDWLKSELEMFYPPMPQEIYQLGGMVGEIERAPERPGAVSVTRVRGPDALAPWCPSGPYSSPVGGELPIPAATDRCLRGT